MCRTSYDSAGEGVMLSLGIFLICLWLFITARAKSQDLTLSCYLGVHKTRIEYHNNETLNICDKCGDINNVIS